MFKLDKNTHMMILFTFALIFVVIYLYYTISDVRKMQRDIARLTSEVSALVQKGGNVSATPPSTPSPSPQPVVPIVQIKECTTTSSVPESVIMEEEVVENVENIENVEVVEDDASSVTTEDIKVTLDAEDDDETVVKSEEVTVHEGTDLNKLKFEEIKEMCRAKGIKIQGSKEVLIKRLMEHE